jgi:RNA-binding protein 25
MPNIGGILQHGVGLLPSPVGITVPTGVASVSAAPVRKVREPPIIPAPQTNGQSDSSLRKPLGPPVTVFVGKISEKVPDSLLRQMLSKCGFINVWKRVDGADGKLQTFGFCEFADPESATTAIRVLNGFDLCGKSLNVKADAKADKIMEEYLKNRKARNEEGSNESGTPLEEEIIKKDTEIKKQLQQLLKDQNLDVTNEDDKTKSTEAKSADLDDMELEEDKRVIINREIDKFRDTYKEQDKEEGVEKDSRRRDDKDRNRRQERSPERLRDRNRRREPNRDQRRPEREQRRDRDEDRRRSDIPDREEEDSEDALERRRLERQLEEKELSYQKRLRNWEDREDRKARDLRDYLRKEKERKEEEIKESKKLKVFLEDYDDERDDEKFYRSTSFKERLRDRQKEIEDDERDRRNELRELQELKQKLQSEGHPDPDSEADKIMNPQVVQPSTSSQEPVNHSNGVKRIAMDDRIKELVGDTSDDKKVEETRLTVNPFTLQKPQSPESKKRAVPDIFSSQDDDEQSSSKKRRLPKLDDEDENSQKSSSEEKKRKIQELISQIPTSKEELFAVDIDWSFVDSSLMDKRIKPWVNKKIAEFIGEEEPALVEFICKKLNTKCSAERILSEVIEVLDEEAEVFVVKLWRLLIFETKAKQHGIAKW